MLEEDDLDYHVDSGAFDIQGHRLPSVVRVGDNLKGRMVSVSCK